MRASIDIDSTLLTEVMEKSGAKTKKAAILIAIKDYIRFKKLQELKGLIGNYDNFGLTPEDLREMRDER
ncbi:MAG: type II toxin-antitoxin system VapB family antitoxin [Candidatus Eremiobacterota bacterium]